MVTSGERKEGGVKQGWEIRGYRYNVENKLQGCIVQDGDCGQYCIISITGACPLKLVNHCIVHL